MNVIHTNAKWFDTETLLKIEYNEISHAIMNISGMKSLLQVFACTFKRCFELKFYYQVYTIIIFVAKYLSLIYVLKISLIEKL